MYIKNVNTDDTIIFQFGLFIYPTYHLTISYLRVDIKKFNDYERTECDGNNVCEGLVEPHDSAKHDHAALVDGFPKPN